MGAAGVSQVGCLAISGPQEDPFERLPQTVRSRTSPPGECELSTRSRRPRFFEPVIEID